MRGKSRELVSDLQSSPGLEPTSPPVAAAQDFPFAPLGEKGTKGMRGRPRGAWSDSKSTPRIAQVPPSETRTSDPTGSKC
ncbi:MAG: hypothetical protein D8M22_09085 [Armatimonadetes bacterium]|nr:hypothetical protein [Armatimonadota bacterium]